MALPINALANGRAAEARAMRYWRLNDGMAMSHCSHAINAQVGSAIRPYIAIKQPISKDPKTNELACAFSTQPRTPRLSAFPERPLGDLPEQHRGGESRGGPLPVAVAAVRCRAGPAWAPA